jgi:Domain of unknown function (DUF4286)
MIIFNVTTNVDDAIHEQWVAWMQKKHIPEILATGKFSSARMVKVLVDEEMGGTTYSAQYTTDSKATLENYYNQDAPAFRAEIQQLFGNKIVVFRTELEVVFEM